MEVLGLIIACVLVGMLLSWFVTARVVRQIERGVVFRLGRAQSEVRKPGLTMLIPIVDRMTKVNIQVVTMPVPAQEGITRDNVTVRVDAVVYFRVTDAWRAAVIVEDYKFAILQVAQTSLRSIIGKSDMDDLLSNREKLNEGLEFMMDSPAAGWGVEIDRVEIKDVALPESMKRSMSRQAEAERERRSRIITADGELQASAKLSQAAQAMSATPAALQLRLLQTMVEVAAEKNSTLVLPFPVEMLRFFEAAASGQVSLPHVATEEPELPATAGAVPELPEVPEVPDVAPEPKSEPVLRSNGRGSRASGSTTARRPKTDAT